MLEKLNLLGGEFPEEDHAWRVMIPVAPQHVFGVTWEFARLLALSNEGEMVAVVVVEDGMEAQAQAVQETLALIAAAHDGKPALFSFALTSSEYQSNLNELIDKLDVDILVDDIADPVFHDLNRLACAVAGVRGDLAGEDPHSYTLRRVLMPTSGGPNSVFALNTLRDVPQDVEVTALYIVREYLGEHEQALGRHRLKQSMDFIDAGDRIESRLISAPSVASGVTQLAGDYDLVIIGASRESSIDKVLFGNIPDTIVRDSKKPVAVIREPKDRVGNFFGRVSFQLQRVIPRLNVSDRTEAYVRIRRSARPTIDFYILIGLATLIAGLGLIANSAAVVIGAMLVAPLMSPIVGVGLSMVLGDTRFTRLSLGAVLRGALLSIFLGGLLGFLQWNQPLSVEILARTNPSLLDLAIALFSGMAGAYALSKSNAAGALPGVAIAAALVPPLATVGITLTSGHFVESFGALLLFITNLVAISSATAFVFLVLGFRPTMGQKARQEVRARSAQVAFISLALVTLLLVGTSYFLGRQEAQEAQIRQIIEAQLAENVDGELIDLNITEFDDGKLVMDITTRTSRSLSYATVEELQEKIGEELVAEGIIDEIAITMSVVRTTVLDPLMPPTPTPEPAAE